MAERKQVRDERKIYGVYIQSILTMKVMIPITQVGKNIKQNLEKIISKKTEGKCIAEGFIRPNSVKVIRYSSGTINNNYIEFQTVFECMVCHPVEGMLVECMTKTITKAGVHAEVTDETGAIPITVFVARDHHFTDRKFAEIKENTKIAVKVIGVRFELNDPYICVIGKYVEKRENMEKKRGGDGEERPRLTIDDEAYELELDDE
jgi:DNA-directed RNA polymerase subunit E'/Rpb7